MPHSARALLAAAALCALPACAHAADADDATVSSVVVTAPTSIANLSDIPNTTSTVTAEDLARTTSVVTPEDALRYVPNVLIRQRHIGDTQSPITSRTSGVGASARTLLFVDGILVSALIGNNNTSASPKWGLINPDAIARVDVLNGPFSAAYAGNSIGSVVAFVTRMPTGFEGHAQVQGAVQGFARDGDALTLATGRLAADLGDARGPLAWRLSASHLDSRGQPLSYMTLATPAAASAAGVPVTGAVLGHGRTGAAIAVLGSGGLEHQAQDNLSGRITWDLTPTTTLAYTAGLFRNDDNAGAVSWLRDAAGRPVYSGQVNIAGRAYSLSPSLFANGVYHLDELQLAQGLSLSSHTGGVFDYDLTLTGFDYLKSRQRTPATAPPAGFAGGPGTDAELDGTGWITFDADGRWRASADHTLSFGAHFDRFTLDNPRYALADWRAASPGALTALSHGRTRTAALWAQDLWRLSPTLKLTLGARLEDWRADHGRNVSAAPALDVAQPPLNHRAASPKAVLAWTPSEAWTFKASAGIAYRFPTVSELYQAVTTGPILSVPDPHLNPERALSSELSAERHWTNGSLRLSLFDERIEDTLLSQAGSLNGQTVNFVQNVDRTRATGLELVGDWKTGPLDLSGWVTWLDTRIEADRAAPGNVGKRLPQLPRLRGAVVATYAATPRLDLTLAARYADRAFGTIDNSDPHANTWQGFGAFFVADARAAYKLSDRVTAALAVTNLTDRNYVLFHPFPQRTVVADLKLAF